MIIKIQLTREENINHYQTSVVEIDLEEYIRGVVPSEVGNAPLEACKAQAVAARSFALYRYKKSGQITDKSSTDQAFRASRLNGNYPNAYQAIEETKDEVLYYNNQLICAYYSSSNGGRIKSSEERWGGIRPYLVSKDDPYDNGNGKGHGVGMSQLGAKTMAAQGFSYKDILNFYYPGTEIRKEYGMTKPNLVVQYAKSKVGCGYVWGASGQVLTEEILRSLHNAHPTHVDMNICRKWIGKQVFDCASFVKYAMRQGGVSLASGASSAWTKTDWEASGTIDTLPVDKVCCLYKQKSDESGMQHTGLYLGNGTFIDARGSIKGVIGPNSMSSYPWTHWGLPKGLYDNYENYKQQEVIKVSYQATVTAANGSPVNMRAGTSIKTTSLMKIPVGTVVDVISTSGDWSEIIYNGKQGYMMSKYLVQVPQSEKNNIWYVKIECASEAEAKTIAAALAKAKATT